MTPHLQKIMHSPDEDRYGDCARTAIACLLDLDPEQVPHWFDGEDEVERRAKERRDWLKDRGYGLLIINYFPEETQQEVMDYTANISEDILYLLVGRSSRGECNHTVVCKGSKVIHDPMGFKSNHLSGPAESDHGNYWFVEIPFRLPQI